MTDRLRIQRNRLMSAALRELSDADLERERDLIVQAQRDLDGKRALVWREQTRRKRERKTLASAAITPQQWADAGEAMLSHYLAEVGLQPTAADVAIARDDAVWVATGKHIPPAEPASRGEPMNDQPSPTIIPPTIGRKVWYWPSNYDTHPGFVHTAIEASDDKQACDATVVYVHGERCVNLQVIDHNGSVHKRFSVTLAQPGDAVPTGGGYAEWMPYQVGQAKAAQPAVVLTDADAAADLAGTPRPDNPSSPNDAQPEPPAAA